MSKFVFKTTKPKHVSDHIQQVEAGAFVFREGDLGTDMYVIHAGEVEILKEFDGGEHQRLALLEVGDFFGEMSVLEDLPRTAAARAVTACQLLQFNGASFDQMLRKNPEIAVRMMRKLSRRLRDTDRRLREASPDDGGEAQVVNEMPPPAQLGAVAHGPERVVHDPSGMEFHLAEGEETTIGRRDPVTGIHPDIDLTPVDTQRSISRRHSKIFRRGGRYYVREEIGTMNGTFINNQRVETGVPMEFKDGDELRFGLVKTRFHVS
ncbi:MAG: cyclic nucleotide-binding domain-containing protein [Acidobacteriota bacterium]